MDTAIVNWVHRVRSPDHWGPADFTCHRLQALNKHEKSLQSTAFEHTLSALTELLRVSHPSRASRDNLLQAGRTGTKKSKLDPKIEFDHRLHRFHAIIKLVAEAAYGHRMSDGLLVLILPARSKLTWRSEKFLCGRICNSLFGMVSTDASFIDTMKNTIRFPKTIAMYYEIAFALGRSQESEKNPHVATFLHVARMSKIFCFIFFIKFFTRRLREVRFHDAAKSAALAVLPVEEESDFTLLQEIAVLLP